MFVRRCGISLRRWQSVLPATISMAVSLQHPVLGRHGLQNVVSFIRHCKTYKKNDIIIFFVLVLFHCSVYGYTSSVTRTSVSCMPCRLCAMLHTSIAALQPIRYSTGRSYTTRTYVQSPSETYPRLISAWPFKHRHYLRLTSSDR